jgi:hypothetical protein
MILTFSCLHAPIGAAAKAVDLIAIVDYEPGAAHLARAEQSSPRGAHYKDAQRLVNPGNRRMARHSEGGSATLSPLAGLAITAGNRTPPALKCSNPGGRESGYAMRLHVDT